MKLLLTISLRNLIRQKRRSILLGIAIAFGTMVLIIAHGFSHGISDNLFNKVIVYVSGHLGVVFSEDGNLFKQIGHDGPRIKQIVKDNIPDVVSVQEAIGVMSRAIGNGKSDNVIMVGMDLNLEMEEEAAQKIVKEAEENFKMIDGMFTDLSNDTIENPVILAKEKADYLNVKKGDVLRVRYRTVKGQNQTARLTIVGVFKPANAFMAAPVFLEVENLKKLVGYGPYEIGQLYITIKEPKKTAVKYAEILQKALKPSVAFIPGTIQSETGSIPMTAIGFKNDLISRKILFDTLRAETNADVDKDIVIISDSLAAAIGKKTGDIMTIAYVSKYDSKVIEAECEISTIAKFNNILPSDIVLINDRRFLKIYNNDLPDIQNTDIASVQDTQHVLHSLLVQEWTLMPRAKNTTELTKLQREIGKNQTPGTTMDIRTMYESASAVLNLEYVLNMITLIAVMILFFIILIGVVNTLRMTVKERTREIGTIRAIGMQKRDVWISFVLETFFLSLFSAITGTVVALVVMFVLTLIKIDAQGNALGMLLVNDHLYFMPTIGSVLFYNFLIILIAVTTAYFPAKKAANLSAAAALRHFE